MCVGGGGGLWGHIRHMELGHGRDTCFFLDQGTWGWSLSGIGRKGSDAEWFAVLLWRSSEGKEHRTIVFGQ